MQKKLVALAVVSVMVAPAAMAGDVIVYGKVHLAVDANSGKYDNSKDAVDAVPATYTLAEPAMANSASDSALAVQSHSSRLGVKGGEELDYGMKMAYQIEFQVEMDEGGSAVSKLRNTYGALAGDFGTVIMGVHDTPYKMSAKKGVEIFSDTIADWNAVIKGDVRGDNVLAYLSPSFGSLSFAVAYIPSYTNDDLPQTDAEGDETATSFSLTYKDDALMVSFASETLNTADNDTTFNKLGGSYKVGDLSFGLNYESIDAGEDAQDNIYASAQYKVDKTKLKLALGQIGESESDEEDGGAFTALGAFQALSKSTEVYAIYASLSNDDDGVNTLKAMKSTNFVAGESSNSFSLGVIHKF